MWRRVLCRVRAVACSRSVASRRRSPEPTRRCRGRGPSSGRSSVASIRRPIPTAPATGASTSERISPRSIVAPDDGVVTFAGKVGGRLFLTIDHGGGLSSTCSWLNSVLVHKGDRVIRGQPVGLTGWGHPDEPVPHLHFGVRLNGTYVDPLAYLGWPSVADLIRLAPLDASAQAPRVTAGRMTSLAYPTMARPARVGGPSGPGVGGVAGRGGDARPGTVAQYQGTEQRSGFGLAGAPEPPYTGLVATPPPVSVTRPASSGRPRRS